MKRLIFGLALAISAPAFAGAPAAAAAPKATEPTKAPAAEAKDTAAAPAEGKFAPDAKQADKNAGKKAKEKKGEPTASPSKASSGKLKKAGGTHMDAAGDTGD